MRKAMSQKLLFFLSPGCQSFFMGWYRKMSFQLPAGCYSGRSGAVPAPRGCSACWDSWTALRYSAFKGGIVLGREELRYITFIDVYGSLWLLSSLWWFGNLALQARSIWKKDKAPEMFPLPFSSVNPSRSLCPPHPLPCQLSQQAYVCVFGWRDGAQNPSL